MLGGTLKGGVRTGLDGVRTTAESDSGGGGGPILPTAPALLMWRYTPSALLPGNNIDAHASGIVGAFDGVNVLGNGQLALLEFTIAGGEPAPGSIVWLASIQDDAGAGLGKATATQPPVTTPAFPAWTQNAVPVGVFMGGTWEPLGHRGVVTLGVPTHPNYAVPIDQTFNFRRATGITATDTFTHDGTLTESLWGPGQTILAIFTVDAIAAGAGADNVLTNFSAAGFWTIAADNSVVIFNRGNAGLNMGNPVPGLNILVATVTLGGVIRASLNGGAVLSQALGGGAAPGVGAVFAVGGVYPGATGWTRGGFTGAAKFLRVLSDPELVTFSTPLGDLATNPFAPAAAVRVDSGCQWWADFTSWVAGNQVVNAGPAGAAWTWTKIGAPVSSAWSVSQNNSPAALMLDGPTPQYSSKYFPMDGQGQRVAFQVANVFDLAQTCLGYVSQDSDNNDEAAFTVIVNNLPLASGILAADGVARQFRFMNAFGDQYAKVGALVAPFNVEIITGDKVDRALDTFMSGAFITSMSTKGATFVTAATDRRALVVSDGQTFGGHSQDLLGGSAPSGAVFTRMRKNYPGRVDGWGCPVNGGVFGIKNWGNGSVIPYAHRLADMSLEGSPGLIEYVICIGFIDWLDALYFAAAFQTDLGAFVDALHALQPTSTIWLAPPIQASGPLGPNANGEHLANFQTAVSNLTAGRAWLHPINLTGPNPITLDVSGQLPSAGTPPTGNDGGAQALADNIQAALGY